MLLNEIKLHAEAERRMSVIELSFEEKPNEIIKNQEA